MSPPTDDSIIAAIDRIIKDTDKKFDECLVEKFVDFIRLQSEKEWPQKIVDRLGLYFDNKAFVMMNQARAYKLLLAIFRDKEIPTSSQAHLDTFWASIGTVIINDHLDSMSVVLPLLENLLNFKTSYQWVISKTIDPSVSKDPDCNISNIVDIASFYAVNSVNYHTRSKAESLFDKLLFKSIENSLPATDPHVIDLKKAIEVLIDKSLTFASTMVADLLHSRFSEQQRTSFLEIYPVKRLFRDKFKKSLADKSVSLTGLCKYWALACDQKEETQRIVKDLKSAGRVEDIVVFLTHSKHVLDWRDVEHQMMCYVLYPILLRCDSAGARSGIGDLKISNDDRDVIDRNWSVKLVTTCLVRLPYTHAVAWVTGLCLASDVDHLNITLTAILEYINKNATNAQLAKNVILCIVVVEILIKQKPSPLGTKILKEIFMIAQQRHELIIVEAGDGFEEYSLVLTRLLDLMKMIYTKPAVRRLITGDYRKYYKDALENPALNVDENISLADEELVEQEMSGNLLVSSSIVDDILNFNLLHDGINDCY